MAGDSRRDANQHLLNITASKGLDANTHIPQGIVKDLEAAIKVLSDQLYQKSTHFLLELVQNADDNRYEVDDPTLHLTYAKNHLRVDCNEIGFSPKDVDAICSIGQSSKAGAGVSTQYVGEKGIGFKSVFKAADVVWVSSREYEFKFDKNAKLGMIAPTLDDFPGVKRAKWTSFYLQLARDYNSQELISDLQSLNACLLIFLRRLRTIAVTIVGPHDQITTKQLTRTEGVIEGNEAIHLSQNDTRMSYIIMRHRARNLPSEQKREGVSESEVLLAFPVDEHNEPKLDPQQVYAFLPIRDYGFKFLIQADFLLIASREDVDNSSKWNQALRDAFVDAFVQCVRVFNSGSLRYTWPRFLPSKPTGFNFFSPLKSRILDRLATEPILEAWSQKLVPAAKLIYVPAKYLDNDGIPLTLTEPKHALYLSQGYSHDEYEQLKLLKVVEMGDSLFLDHLEDLTKYQRDYFFAKPPEWHSRLAAVLAEIWKTPQAGNRRRMYRMPSVYDDIDPRKPSLGRLGDRYSNFLRSDPDDDDSTVKFQERIMKLPLIRLRDGRWVCREDNTIFFPGDSKSWQIPGGISLLVVDPSVAKDLPRAHLFRLLGVKDFKINSVTEIIVSLHTGRSFDARSVSREDLISHIRFLYTTGWRNVEGKGFWFATEFDGRALGSAIYIDDAEVTHPASKFFSQSRSRFQFLHPDYQNAHPQDPSGWLAWLKVNMSLSNIPRLIRPIREIRPSLWTFEMSADFEYIFQAWSPLDALTLLCDHWVVYQLWIEPPTKKSTDPAVEASYRNLKKKISAMAVKCTDGSSHRLDETFLPMGDVPAESGDCVSFLDVPEPEHHRWQHLIHFGVGVKQDVGFFLRCLENLAGSACGLKQAAYFYEQIQARCNEDQTKVVKFFNEKNRRPVFIPFSLNAEVAPDDGAWFNANQCLWNGPKCLKVHFSMKDIYPSCARLFRDIIGVSDASMKELIFEAVLFTKTEDLEYMREVYLELEKFLEKDKTYTMRLQSLNGKAIWPVTTTIDQGKFDQILSPEAEWFIADTEPLRESFMGIVPLLAFGTDDIGRMERLLAGLEMDNKRLTRATKSFPKTEGNVVFQPEHTNAFQSKYEFIARLVQPSAIDRGRRKRILTALQKTEIFTAEHIVQRYLVKFGNKEVEGRQFPGNVVLSPEEDSLKIYLKDKYLERERNPCELVEKVASFAAIDERKNGQYLLHVILTESNPNRILAILATYGVPMSYPDDEEEGSEWLSENGRKGAVPGNFGRDMPHLHSTETLTIISSTNARSADGNEDEFDTEGPGFGSSSSFENPMLDSPFGPGFRIVAPNNRHSQGNGSVLDEELEFAGEDFVFHILAEKLKGDFVPEEHWTSSRRVKAGFSLPEGVADFSPFTIKDTQGAWTSIVARSGIPEAGAWKSRPPTWHIEVRTTRESLSDEFSLTAAQFDKARKFCIRTQEEKQRIPSNVVLLVRVFNIEQNPPQFAMFMDPWALYLAGTLRLKSSGTYFGRVNA